MGKFTIREINNKSNSKMLIQYLEMAISDELILSSFVRDLEIMDMNEEVVIIGVTSDIAKDYLSRDYVQIFESGIREIFNKALKVKIIRKSSFVVLENKKKHSNIIKTGLNSKFTFANYVVSSFNETAKNAVIKIINNPGVFSPFFIYSTSGLGKTHLLHATGNMAFKKNKNVLYLNPDYFTAQALKVIKQGQEEIEKFIKNIIKYDIIMFDDIQNLGNRVSTLKILFNIINLSIEKNKQIIIAADRTPREMGGFEERFITRFEKGLTLEIKKPNINDLIKILKFKLEKEDLHPEKWETEALKFIARNHSTSIRSIEGAVTRVKFMTLDESNIKYTYLVVTNIFKSLAINKDELTPSHIINVVSAYYKVNKNDIYGKTRRKQVVVARHIAMWLIRSINRCSYQKIGQIFSGRDHSTVMSAINKIDVSMRVNNAVKQAVSQLETKIKQIT